ncbi:MAG: helix-turn-helix domain-containing protein [Leptodesmis sp.]|uniref:helix-turn-helix domain-containing protein n=1 Tax=Leptodesmis sp. TaxID=3100501 RepID=UPI003D12D894
MRIAYQYRLRPTPNQVALMGEWLELQRVAKAHLKVSNTRKRLSLQNSQKAFIAREACRT